MHFDDFAFPCRDIGAKVELLGSKQLQQKFPWINTDGIEMGSYGKLFSINLP